MYNLNRDMQPWGELEAEVFGNIVDRAAKSGRACSSGCPVRAKSILLGGAMCGMGIENRVEASCPNRVSSRKIVGNAFNRVLESC
jgi:hypothetical protein